MTQEKTREQWLFECAELLWPKVVEAMEAVREGFAEFPELELEEDELDGDIDLDDTSDLGFPEPTDEDDFLDDEEEEVSDYLELDGEHDPELDEYPEVPEGD